MGRPPTTVEGAVRRIAADITRGVYAPGSWLPPSRDLCVTLGVSRTTIGRALRKLAEQGLVEIHKLRGAKVTMEIPHRSGRDRAVTTRRTGRIYEQGEYATIAAAMADAPDDVAEALGLEPGAPVIRRHRITHNPDGVTIESASTSWYDGAFADVAPLLLTSERIPEGSWAYLEAMTGRTAVRGADTIEARMATAADAEDLGIDLPAAVKVTTSVLRDDFGRVVEYGVSVAAAGRRATYEFDVPAAA